MAQWVEHVNIAQFIFLNTALLVQTLYALFITVIIEKTSFNFISFSTFFAIFFL